MIQTVRDNLESVLTTAGYTKTYLARKTSTKKNLTYYILSTPSVEYNYLGTYNEYEYSLFYDLVFYKLLSSANQKAKDNSIDTLIDTLFNLLNKVSTSYAGTRTRTLSVESELNFDETEIAILFKVVITGSITVT
ncbi:MAG: hypothetical protein GY714_20870 [Desulfobacterales bacterium]|nr:hypothetical protein [Desulfobacterales bacterium]